MHRVFLAIAILMVAGIVAPAQTEDESEWALSEKTLFLSYGDLTVQSMPLEVRNVPMHPDDTGTPGAIAQEKFDSGFNLQFAMSFKQFDFAGGKLKPQLIWMFNTGDTAKRNYTNAPGTSQRGYGAALTYVNITQRALPGIGGDEMFNFFTNINPCIAYTIPLGQGDVLLGDKPLEAEISIGYFRLQAATGWDRYDSMEVRKYYVLANCFPVTIGLQKNNWLAGLRWTLVSPTDLGKDAQIESPKTFFVGYRFANNEF